jgi:hypothetical protein
VAASDNQGEESSGGGGGGVAETSSGVSAAPPKEIPAAIKKSCQRATGDNAWMVGGWGATEQWTCHVGSDLNYAVFSSAGEARGTLREVYGYTLQADAEPEDRAKKCDKATEAQITAAKGQWKGTTRCTVGVTPGENADDLSIYWNDQGSPVVGLLTVGSDTKPHDAVNGWAELISTH